MGGPPSKSFLSEMQNIHRRKNLEAGVGPGVPPGGPLGVTPGVATSPPSANATSTLADQLRSRLEERRKSKEEEQQPQQHSVGIGILLPKLFWPTVRKKCSSDPEKLLKFEAEGREFAKFLRSLEQFIQTEKGQNNIWQLNAFLTCSWSFLISNKLEQL